MKRIQTREAAKQLGVSGRTVQRMCGTGELKAVRIGGLWTICQTEIDNYLMKKNGRNTCQRTYTRKRRVEHITLASKLTGETLGDRYTQLIGELPSNASKLSSKRRKV